LKSYLKNEYQPYTSKMTPLEFPVLQKPAFNSGTQSAVEFDENYTNMVFCGAVVDTFRSPKAFLEVFENALKENPNMRIYFVGTNHSGVLNGFIKRLPNNIFATGLVPNSVAMETMKQADFLVNIGNGIENQVPSKIFEYFSYGKPTITTIKMKNCPSISYFERYGNALILDEKTRASTNAIDFLEFVKNNKGKEIGYDEVLTKFFDCTPEAVAKTMWEKLQ
ncbi:MAG: glycosyltransferase, partial [Oscillospiraceae bacterium]